MIIRKADVKDIPRLAELLVQVCSVHADKRPDLFCAGGRKYDDRQLEELLGNTEKPVFVACDENDRVLGYAFCILKKQDSNALTDIRTLYIDDLCVDENSRGQHIGSALYEYVLNFARENGCYNVTLNVWACNEPAMKFYEKCGMKVQKTGMETIL